MFFMKCETPRDEFVCCEGTILGYGFINERDQSYHIFNPRSKWIEHHRDPCSLWQYSSQSKRLQGTRLSSVPLVSSSSDRSYFVQAHLRMTLSCPRP